MLTFATFVTSAIVTIYVVGWFLVFAEAGADRPLARAAAVATIWPASAASLLWRRR